MSKRQKGGCPETRQLMRELRPGYTVRPTGGAKLVVLDPAGNPVRKPGTSLPVLLSNSPQTHGRYVQVVRRWLVAAGAIEGVPGV